MDVESQLAELQRKYRILEARWMLLFALPLMDCVWTLQNNRKAYCEDAQATIRRQRAAIEKLQAENSSVKAEVDACSSVRSSTHA